MDRLEAVSGCDPAALAEFAAANGYLWLHCCIDPPVVEALGRLVDQAYADAGGDLAALYRAVLPSPELDALRSHPALLAALHAVMGDCLPQQGDVVRYVRPGDPPTPPHQDARYLGLEKETWTAWVPLDDCPLALGPLAVWPGSRRLGLLAHDDAGLTPAVAAEAQWASADLACGDVVLFHSLTAHQSLENRASRARRSVDLRYAR